MPKMYVIDDAPTLQEFTPTPEQIAEECRAIQSEWSDAERERRFFAVPHSAICHNPLFLYCRECGKRYEVKSTCQSCVYCRSEKAKAVRRAGRS